ELHAGEGRRERLSMVYTEYFARGTEPTAYCDQHPTRGIMAKVAGVFGNQDKPAPPHVDEPAVAPAPTPTASAEPAPVSTDVPPEAPKKKRGFWSRLFGIGKDDARENKKNPDQPNPKKKGGE